MRTLTFMSLIVLVAQISLAAPTAWIANYNLTIHQVDAATNAEVPAGGFPAHADSLARTPTGQLICDDPAGNLWNVTGAPIPAGSTGRTQIGDLDYGNGGLWGYSNASSELFFFDLSTWTVSYAQPIAVPGTVTGVAYQPGTGDIYLSSYASLNNDFLYRVPFMGVAAVPIGAMSNGDAFSYFSDIDFAPSGNLIGVTFYHRYFYNVSTSTAATTLLSTGPHRDTTAMALNPVPEPATFALLPAAAAMLLRRKRR